MPLYLVIIASTLFLSCATNKPILDRVMTSQDYEAYEIIGFVETTFESTKSTKTTLILEKAYSELFPLAQDKYDANIDVMNIVIEKRSSTRNIWHMLAMSLSTRGAGYTSYFIAVHAKGLVVQLKEN